VTEKGVDLLLEALARLKRNDLRPSLTIIGDGPERKNLEEQSKRLDLSAQVTFAGAKQTEEVADLLHQHQLLVIPSRYDEPFGIVALEGIACGCAVIGSAGGGLPEAIGPCGVTFPNGDINALAQRIEELLARPEERGRLLSESANHLSKFDPAKIAKRYVAVFESLL
jgi:glycosyltransferase involved in cell wall biosynthesis